MSKLHVSQFFYSFQGEGRYTGHLAVWMRTFGCNLRCPGFSQPNPADPSTYIKPITFDPKSIKTLDEFPVVSVGCDTLYAIDPKFKHLRQDLTPTETITKVLELLPNPDKFWVHPKTLNDIHFCITGGEPLLQQNGLKALFDEWHKYSSFPKFIQFETNGTQRPDSDLFAYHLSNSEVHFNVSLKLHNVSGEDYEWDADIIQDLIDHSGQECVDLKIVVNNSDAAWRELDRKMGALYKGLGNWLPRLYIMPVGSTYEQQTDSQQIEAITKRALAEGYHVSGRLHCVTLGNAIDA